MVCLFCLPTVTNFSALLVCCAALPAVRGCVSDAAIVLYTTLVCFLAQVYVPRIQPCPDRAAAEGLRLVQFQRDTDHRTGKGRFERSKLKFSNFPSKFPNSQFGTLSLTLKVTAPIFRAPVLSKFPSFENSLKGSKTAVSCCLDSKKLETNVLRLKRSWAASPAVLTSSIVIRSIMCTPKFSD